VIGAGSGIGEGVALSLAEQGANRMPGKTAIESIGDRCSIIRWGDSISTSSLSDRSNPDEDIRRLTSGFEPTSDRSISLFIAPVSSPRSRRADPDRWFEIQYRTNVLARYGLTQALVPLLPPHCGQIVFVNSSAGLAAPENLSQCAARSMRSRLLPIAFARKSMKTGYAFSMRSPRHL